MRVLSAAVLVVLVFSVLWLLPPWATVAVAALAAAIAAGELASIMGRLSMGPSPVAAGTAAAVVVVAFVASMTQVPGDAIGVVLLALVIASGAVVLGGHPPGPATPGLAAAFVMVPLYVALPLGAVSVIHLEHGAAATTWLLLIVAVSDSAQYYCGGALGRRKLAPLVSPGKTVEGAVGGVSIGTIVGAFTLPVVVAGIGVPAAALVTLILLLAGIVGDLFESLVKRSAGVKDSSALIPGHGGVLDRIDSHLFAAPVFFVFLRYFA